MKDKLLEIINHYGILNQLKYLHTEYFELDEAIINYEQIHHIVDNIEEKKKITEELADVIVMLKQIKEYYKISDEELLKMMDYKTNRQIDRIKTENYGRL